MAEQKIKDVPNVSYPDQLRDAAHQMVSMVKLLTDIPNSLPTLRRVFRGEALQQDETGRTQWIQVVKPMFIKTHPLTEEPVIKEIILNNEKRKVFLPNDEAIEEILSMLYAMGVNQITPITNISEENILDDLKEFECKLAGVLALKQKSWGIDKSLLPMVMLKIKTIVQDVRYMSCKGTTLKAIQTTISRVEQLIEGDRSRKINVSPYT